MATQPQRSRPDQLKEPQRLPLGRLTLVLLILVLGIGGIVVGILNSWQNHVHIAVSISIIIAFFTCAFVLLQLSFPFYFLPDKTKTFTFQDKSSAAKAAFRGSLGIPPLTNSKIILQRQEVINDVYERLIHPNASAVVLKGIGGVGKSTLAALLSEHVESQRRATQSPFTAEPIWLTIDATVTMVDLLGTLLQVLKKPMPHLDKMTSSEQVKAFCKVIGTTRHSRLVILDQFENLLDPQTGQALAEQAAIDELIEALQKQKYKNRVLLVTRSWPQGHSKDRGHLYEYNVEGLTTDEGGQLLKQRGTKASSEELRMAVEYCEGHPLALALLASLTHEYHLDLSGLFNNPTYVALWTEAIARNLLDDIFKRQVSEEQRNLLFDLAIYHKPISLGIVQETMKAVAQTEVRTVLNGLLSQCLLQETNVEYYRLHSIVATYIKHSFLKKHSQDRENLLRTTYDFTTKNLSLQKAAIVSLPKATRQYSNDLPSLIEAIWHFCQANQWRQAYELMKDEKSNLVGRSRAILLELFQLLLPLDRWRAEPEEAVCIYYHIGWAYADLGKKEEAVKYYDQALAILRKRKDGTRLEEGRTLNDLGRVYSILGKKKESLEYLEEALKISKNEKDRKWEIKVLNNLSLVCNDLGRRREALEYLEQALDISREENDRLGEGRTLNNLGQIYTDLGNKGRAKQYYEWALSIRREKRDLHGEGTTLRNLGLVYADLGKKEEALRYLGQALHLHREVGDLRGQGQKLNRLGRIYVDLGQTEEALKYLEEALSVLQEVGDRWEIDRALNNLVRLYWMLGRKEDAQSHLEEALKLSRIVGDRKGEGRILNYMGKVYDNVLQKEELFKSLEQALDISREIGDQKGEGWTLHNLGLAYVSLSQQDKALKYFEQALRIRREVADRRGEGWTLYNIGLFYHHQKRYDIALAYFLSARDIFNAIDSPHFDETQNHIDKMRKEVGARHFKALLVKVEPEVSQIIEHMSQNQ